MRETERILERHRRRHVFRVFRYPMRFTVGPIFVSFAIVDYLYITPYYLEGLVLRLIWYAMIWAGFYLLRTRKIRDKYTEAIPAVVLVGACWIVNWMMFRSGGYLSLYITGLVLVDVTGLQLIGFSRKPAAIVNLLSSIPTFVVVWASAGMTNWKEGVIQSIFLSVMTLLAWFYKSSGDEDAMNWATQQMRVSEEVVSLRRTEMLKKHFPAFLRTQIESGNLEIPKKKLYTSAVLGFADIASSTTIGNEVDIAVDWELKEKFLEAAVTRATENGLIVLSQLGDGCYFLANYQGGDSWPVNIVAFFENLALDFQRIKTEVGLNHLVSETGIKFGLSMGPAIVGFIGKDQPYFTANGPDANLASRLCAEAAKDELVVSSRVWYVLKNHIRGWDVQQEVFENLKGFGIPVPAVRVRPRFATKTDRPVCATCGAQLSVISTPEGLLDVKCANGHVGDQAGNSFTKKAA